MTQLTNADYKQILVFYKQNIPKTERLLKLEAEKFLASKLCRCIKTVSQKEKNETRAIGICTKSVINTKGITRGNFKCKRRATIKLFKNKNKNKNNKTRINKK